MQARSQGDTAWHRAVISQERHCLHIQGSPGMGAGSHCTWLDRKARSGSKRCRANRIVAGEQREQPALPGVIAATRKPVLHRNPDTERRLRTQGFQTLDIPGGTRREQGVCVEGRRWDTHPGRSNTLADPTDRQVYLSPSPLHQSPSHRFCCCGSHMCKDWPAFPPFLCLLLCSDLSLSLKHTVMARDLVVVEDKPT